MHSLDRWIILDTETTGLRDPIYPVEIAAQVMSGWKPSGEPFRVLINFDVPIEPAAEKIHGYSREYLNQHGLPPNNALAMFLDYAGALPIVAYNLTYDCNRVLSPTLDRINTRTQLTPGFCALNLTRHVVPTLPDFKLKTVIQTFGLAENQSHHANDDVRLLAQFLSEYIGPHLLKSEVVGFSKVAACAKGSIIVPPLTPPTSAKKSRKPKVSGPDARVTMRQLISICRTIQAMNADKPITADELNFLADWLERCPYAGVQPISGMFEMVQDIVADGQVTSEEMQHFSQAVDKLVQWQP
jgi:DNA polymerase III epsilon subunit-like protein